jgi:hypothetical protein
MKKISDWLKGKSNAFRAAVNTAWQTFLGVFLIALLGFLGDVVGWLNGAGEFPSVTPLGKAAIAGAAAAASFLVTWVIRTVQQARDPFSGPQYK